MRYEELREERENSTHHVQALNADTNGFIIVTDVGGTRESNEGRRVNWSPIWAEGERGWNEAKEDKNNR